jgi:hypothetical protein
MGEPRFPFPVSVHEIVSLLNASDEDWSLTVLQDHNGLRVERDQRNVPPDTELDDIRAGLTRFGNLKPVE